MNERHRQIKFPDPLEFEIDPERALWVPGRKKIFLPSAPKVGIDWGFSPPRMMVSLDFETRLLSASDFFAWCKNCVPSRSEILTPDSPRMWNDIRRSEVPVFRSGRDLRIPVTKNPYRYNW